MSDKNSNSFSSFADLKDLQIRLRQQEADQAQAKADAIVVKEGSEHLNPLKQKAAQVKQYSSQAPKAHQGQNKSSEEAHETNHEAQSSFAKNKGLEQARAKSTHERSNSGSHNERSERRAKGDRNKRKERYQNERSNNDNQPSQERLEHALNRLQRKADSLNRHHEKDLAKESNKVNSNKSANGSKVAMANDERPEAKAHLHNKGKAKGKDKVQNQAKSKCKAPLLQGKYFDVELLKLVRLKQDDVSYQVRRTLYRKLSELDSFILQMMQDLISSPEHAKVCSVQQPLAKDSAQESAVLVDNKALAAKAEQGQQEAKDEQLGQGEHSYKAEQGSVACHEGQQGHEGHNGQQGHESFDGQQGQDRQVDKRELLNLVLSSSEYLERKEQVVSLLESEVEAIALREQNVPKLEYPEVLPVSQRKDEIVKAIREHQVVIIAGETGSGKTTQIPKMCLEAGLGRKGLIGHTQPRRIAARAVASRIAEELHEQLGNSVSYKVRFTDISSPNAYIKLMTDGILLSELASDRLLLNYDVIIIDEAHERSLNIDFLLGYLKNLLEKRPELKLIITSATIDVERFAQHFNGAPIIEVSGRTYPVEVVYMPLMEDNKGVYIEGHDGKGYYEHDHKSNNHLVASRDKAIDEALAQGGPGEWRDYQSGNSMATLRAAAAASLASNQASLGMGVGSISGAGAAMSSKGKSSSTKANNYGRSAIDDDRDVADTMDLRQGILQAIHYLQARGRGDTLVFLPGERDILEIAQFLRKAGLKDTEIVPLYARLATNEQNKIFTEHTGVRIVLATNVAETSLTVPGIRYVIDPGLARISRYSSRTKVQRLPIEPISQASANQRKGRCGRVSDGICVRLYSKEDFDNRPEFTDPEILRTNLASVLLQMASLRLGKIENFPFIDAPAPRQVSDGLRLLDELGAVSDKPWSAQGSTGDRDQLQLTNVGRTLSRLPCDPRLGRMMVEASKYHALSEVIIIVSALAVMDPREYPLDKKEAATQWHKRFNDDKSDFLSILKLYDYIKELQSSLSSSALRRQLKQEFISFLRVREWLDVHRQLRISAQLLGMNFNQEKADYESIHRSLISGLLSHMGMIEPNGNNYIGARGSRFVIFPASPLAKKPPKWICASELSETSRLFARTVAAIDPIYAESCGGHLIKNAYHEPHWSKKNGAVMAYLTRSIYGLPIVQKRLVQYQDIDPKLCRELMIRDGFVEGNIQCNHRFFNHNISLIDDVEYLEDKVRRRDLLVDSSTLEQFYDERIPEDICNMRDFDKWWKAKSKEDPNYLDFSYELIAKSDIMAIEDKLYPEFWHQGPLRYKLSYVFDIGSERDGVTVHIPITVLNQVRAEEFLWQIDGLRQELFATLIRSLPKRLRRNLIPAPEYAKALDDSLKVYTKSINQSEDSSSESLSGQSSNKAQGKGNTKCKGQGNGLDNLFMVVSRELTRMGGEIISPEDFDKSLIPDYLFVNFSIEGVDGKEIAFGKDFATLSSRLQGKAREVLHQVVKSHKVSAPAQSWEYGTIKKEQVTKQGSLRITAYPALTDRGDGVTLELYDSPERQAKAMAQGAIKLIALSLKSPTSYLETHLPNRAKLSMYYQPLGSIKELIFDLMLCAINNIVERNGGVPWDEENFLRLKEIVRGELNDEALAIAKIIEQSLVKAHELKRLLKGNISFDLARSYADISAQLDGLIYKGFISQCGSEHLSELPRYLQAAIERIQRLNRDVVRDQMYMRTLDNLNDEYQKVLKSYHEELIPPPLKEVKWMIEELRVSYFAQHLGVSCPISDKRIYAELERIQSQWLPQK